MTRSPALTSSASAAATRKHESTVAQAIARVMDINASFLICIWWSSFDRFRRSLHGCVRCVSLVHKVERGMQRAEHADNGEDCEPQSNLDDTIARELTERYEPRLNP